ncbi:MAG: family 20 glycosylhydrolase [Planctomycetota bacterium]
MRKILLYILLICISPILLASCALPAKQHQPWRGVHVLMTTQEKTEQLTEVVGELADLGINVIIAEINYGYEYKSHPELRAGKPSKKEQIKKLAAECRKHRIRLIPQFQCLGHQSWREHISPLLVKYPQFDETPGQHSSNEGIYCRSWCPLQPDVNRVVFELMNELIDAFEADAFHVGMDEVFLIGNDACPRCKGKNKAKLFAKAVNDYHKYLVEKHKLEMLMWGDRLIDARKINYGKWEASANDTAGAIYLIPKDIIICDWHYEARDTYESIPMFLGKGFRVWPAGWRKLEATKALTEYSQSFNHSNMLGHLNTTWGAVPIKELAMFEPIVFATNCFR